MGELSFPRPEALPEMVERASPRPIAVPEMGESSFPRPKAVPETGESSLPRPKAVPETGESSFPRPEALPETEGRPFRRPVDDSPKFGNGFGPDESGLLIILPATFRPLAPQVTREVEEFRPCRCNCQEFQRLCQMT
jgi:hypothetical protein